MKPLLTILLLFIGISLNAQDSQSFSESYQRQVRNVGITGVGVETIINKWEEAFPDDKDMLLAKFTFYYNKSQSSEMIIKDAKKYLGAKPVVTLKDSLGRDVNYFEVISYDDEVFGQSLSAINQIISQEPKESLYLFLKITALMDYEKEDPNMAVVEINNFIDTYKADPKAYLYDNKELDEETFRMGVAEYCVTLFNLGTEPGYKYFLELSKKMNKIYPKDVVFINNLGSYYQVHDKNYNKAKSYYKKSLKLQKDNYAATQNLKIIDSLQKKK